MEVGSAPWQRPWSQRCMKPINPTTGNAYRGVNRVLLAIAAAGRSSGEFMTYRQAAERGWQVRAGERGSMIVKVVEIGGGEARSEHEREEAKSQKEQGLTPRALRRYFVFNRDQIDGMPPLDPQPEFPAFDPIMRAEAVVQALTEKTGLSVREGGSAACYIPSRDEMILPARSAFQTAHDWHATQLHEAAHSTLHERRLNRTAALGKRWGDAAYAMEELRAEICSAILAAETGVPMSQRNIEAHAAYLRDWVKVIANEPMAIFSAAKDAEVMAEYLLKLEHGLRAERREAGWVAEYDAALSRSR
ncbi:zincin-like metallopeptidase domain-containing protein [Aquincola tertiaricarbonis]|uniref:Zincin-like metallopeptidase domain-containing protein n=2 Tax=Aquincola tertiaricarbonis TaxID=391953 RepID=A0ABY4SID8_AQUTE|nr:zincin-like metallopeptidase domain-containing protein [Aquincola tertiaricarbonis]